MAAHIPPLDDAAVGRAVGVSRSTAARWTRGESLPERSHVVKLSKLFNVSPAVILRMTDNEALEEEIANGGSQEELASLLAHVPELGDFVRGIWKLPPEKRAALILLVRSLLPPD